MLKILLISLFLIIMYLRRPLKLINENRQINLLREFYESFSKSNSEEEKIKFFQEIAKRKTLSNELIGVGLYLESPSPSYQDFHDTEKIRLAYFRLREAFDNNVHWIKKYMNPKYLFKDMFFLPAALFGFLLKQPFSKVPSFLLSCLGWTATIFISTYSAELRILIDSLIDKIN